MVCNKVFMIPCGHIKLLIDRYEFDSLTVDLIISFMEIDILKEQKSELEVKEKKEDQSERIDSFCDYGFFDI